MNFWFDIANAPHATLFKPIVAELEKRGHHAFITAWDRGQTASLTRRTWPEAELLGSGFRTSRLTKGTAMLHRSSRLLRATRTRRLDVAVSHNSYSQIVAASRANLPAITMMDYEHQPANHLAFRLATKVIVPQAIPSSTLRRLGAGDQKVIRSPWLKEEIALSSFVPDPSFRQLLSIPENQPLITLRPAPEGALYHRGPNTLFRELLAVLTDSGAALLLSPRTTAQAHEFEGTPGMAVLKSAVSGGDLLFHSDLFVGAGGTMTREAAVLGTRTFSIFAGKPGAVDQRLISSGRMQKLANAQDLPLKEIRRVRGRCWVANHRVTRQFVDLLVSVADDIRLRSGQRL